MLFDVTVIMAVPLEVNGDIVIFRIPHIICLEEPLLGILAEKTKETSGAPATTLIFDKETGSTR